MLGIIGTTLADELAISTSTIDVADNLGRTALYWAARRGDLKATTLLLDYGANTDPPRKRRKGTSPLLAAAEAGNVDIVEQLIAHKAAVDVRNQDDACPLHRAATLKDGLRCVQALLQAGADVNCVDSDNRTPLLTATCYGWVDIAETLLAAGADIEALCEDGWTSLTSSIFWNMHSSVNLLLDKGASTLVVTDQGETLLHLTVRYGDTKMLEMLASRDLGPLDAEAKTGSGETVYDIADARDETTEWQNAFQALLKSIDGPKSASLSTASTLAGRSRGFESSDALLDLKIAREIIVENYAASDDGSELDHFEDALEIVV